MRRLVQLLIPLVLAGALLLSIRVVLAEPDTVTHCGPDRYEMLKLAPDFDARLVRNGPLSATTILTITNKPTGSVFIQNQPVLLTATVNPEPEDASGFFWEFGDGCAGRSGEPDIIHHFTVTGPHTITAYVMGDNDFPIMPLIFGTKMVTVTPNIFHLPLIMKKAQPDPPNLFCRFEDPEDAVIAGEPIEVMVTVTSTTALADGFWIDLYINPDREPTVNTKWETLCQDDPDCPGGLAWEVSDQPIYAGESRTFISVSEYEVGPNGYDEDNSQWPDSLPANIYHLYAYVDSWSPDYSPHGAVSESNEDDNRCGPLVLVVSPAAGARTDHSMPQQKLPANPSR